MLTNFALGSQCQPFLYGNCGAKSGCCSSSSRCARHASLCGGVERFLCISNSSVADATPERFGFERDLSCGEAGEVVVRISYEAPNVTSFSVFVRSASPPWIFTFDFDRNSPAAFTGQVGGTCTSSAQLVHVRSDSGPLVQCSFERAFDIDSAAVKMSLNGFECLAEGGPCPFASQRKRFLFTALGSYFGPKLKDALQKSVFSKLLADPFVTAVTTFVFDVQPDRRLDEIKSQLDQVVKDMVIVKQQLSTVLSQLERLQSIPKEIKLTRLTESLREVSKIEVGLKVSLDMFVLITDLLSSLAASNATDEGSFRPVRQKIRDFIAVMEGPTISAAPDLLSLFFLGSPYVSNADSIFNQYGDYLREVRSCFTTADSELMKQFYKRTIEDNQVLWFFLKGAAIVLSNSTCADKELETATQKLSRILELQEAVLPLDIPERTIIVNLPTYQTTTDPFFLFSAGSLAQGWPGPRLQSTPIVEVGGQLYFEFDGVKKPKNPSTFRSRNVTLNIPLIDNPLPLAWDPLLLRSTATRAEASALLACFNQYGRSYERLFETLGVSSSNVWTSTLSNQNYTLVTTDSFPKPGLITGLNGDLLVKLPVVQNKLYFDTVDTVTGTVGGPRFKYDQCVYISQPFETVDCSRPNVFYCPDTGTAQKYVYSKYISCIANETRRTLIDPNYQYPTLRRRTVQVPFLSLNTAGYSFAEPAGSWSETCSVLSQITNNLTAICYFSTTVAIESSIDLVLCRNATVVNRNGGLWCDKYPSGSWIESCAPTSYEVENGLLIAQCLTNERIFVSNQLYTRSCKSVSNDRGTLKCER